MLSKIKIKDLINVIEQIIEPVAPIIVLFGLILLNFGPLNVLPKIYPPISDATQR